VTPSLTGKQRRHLRALAHDLKAVVQVGHSGLTPGVLAALENALETHELVKVKILTECPEDPRDMVEPLEKATRSSVAQVIGRTLIVYRRRKDKPIIQLPKADALPGKRG
jgi:RNA-binding protein